MQTIHVQLRADTVIELLREGNESAFEQVFKEHFKSLYAYAYTFLKDEALAEEMVQNVFCRIWEKRDLLQTGGSLKSYLYRAVHNESINYLKRQKVKANYESHYLHQTSETYDHIDKKIAASELQKQISKAIMELPQQCRIVFQMSRFEELKYKDIAARLGISIKTVENQMGKALKLLRQKLVEFLPAILIVVAQFLHGRDLK